MELFLSDAQPADTLSLALELYTVYVRASQRDLVQMTRLNPNTLSALQIEQVPLLVKSVTEPQADNTVKTIEARLTNPFSIMLEIAKACYLEDVLFQSAESTARVEISQFIEMVGRLSAEELAAHVNTHMATRMFLVGDNITAADVVVFSALAPYMSEKPAYQKLETPHLFRYVDHIQHLPGMLEQVHAKNIFTAFPDLEAEGGGPSKSQLKKLAKAQALKEAKAKKSAGGEAAPQQKGQQAQGADAKKPAAAAAGGEESKEQQPKKQKQKQVQKPKAAAAPVGPDEAMMDIRVGKIVECWVHPESVKLYCERIDIGNGEIREIASGLQSFVPLEQMQGAMVIVICNLRAKKLAGFPSHGMVLCGETPDKSAVELLCPPAGSEPGDLVTFEGCGRDPPAALHKEDKKNPWFRVAPDFTVDAEGNAKWKNAAWTTPKGKVTSATIRNGVIH